MKFLIILFLMLLPQTDKPKLISITGKLVTPVYAIGGETTGFVVEVKDDYYELSFTNEDEEDRATKLNGKMVQVTGTLVIKDPVEKANGKRKIIEQITVLKEKK